MNKPQSNPAHVDRVGPDATPTRDEPDADDAAPVHIDSDFPDNDVVSELRKLKTPKLTRITKPLF